MRKILVFFFGILLALNTVSAQAPKKLTSSEAFLALQKLNFLGTALYIAAHPDDENTRLISYLSNNVKARTGYLSITRGDGGQNLIGPELRELLGVLRTQELLAARRIDGGQQFFTRANDFGYSKHPKETLKIWDKESVLADVVWVIRNFKPDVIINRFDHRTPGSNHGHHTSSAMLSMEAFDLTANKAIYPEQLSQTEIWQPKRLFFNTSWWFYGSRENFEKADKSNMLNFDTGVYYPMIGLSNNEIASMASSQHLCQGFGRLSSRGTEKEYVELLKGDLPGNKDNIFDGIDTSWSRVKGGAAVGAILYAVADNFNFEDPSVHLEEFVKAHKLIQKIEDQHWKRIKTQEIEELIAAVTGLYLEASTKTAYTSPGSSVKVGIEALNRSSADIRLKSVKIGKLSATANNIILQPNIRENIEMTLDIPADASYSSPYWLTEKGSLGMYKVDDIKLIGNPETPRKYKAVFELELGDYTLNLERAVVYRYSKPEKGELYEPFEILPEASSRIEDKVIIFADSSPKQIPVTIKALKDNLKGEVQLCFAEGWKVSKEIVPFEIANKGEEKTVLFTVTPPEKEDENYIAPIVRVDGKAITKELVQITYDHVPTQSVLLPSEAKVVRLNIEKAGEHIGYIAGAGDKVPESLEQIGYTVHQIAPSDIKPGSLDKYDAVVIGIRAYNVVPELKFKQELLFDYVHQGGNLVVQYNTAGRWDKAYDNIAPYPLKLSRDRVTNENSPVEIIAKDHALVNFPNKILPEDFDGWVQERGLYFPNEWDSKFTAVFSMNDEDESPTQGSLLVSPHGKGHYIYTGLSFFRELPAGVPGAYKIFANMLSIGQDKVNAEIDIKG